MSIYANMPKKGRLETALKIGFGIIQVPPSEVLSYWYQLAGYEYMFPEEPPTVEEIKEKAVDVIMSAFKAITGED